MQVFVFYIGLFKPFTNLLLQVKMTHQRYVINAKSLAIFLEIAQKVHLRWIEIMLPLVEAKMV
jgi:hypothetical protein